MKIQTQYDIGDRVYTMYSNEIIMLKIDGIQVDCNNNHAKITYEGSNGMTYGTTDLVIDPDILISKWTETQLENIATGKGLIYESRR